MSDTPVVWMNGELMPADEVRVSPFDLGLTVGHGVFETMVSYDGIVFAQGRHLQRLASSLEKLSLPVISQNEVEDAVSQVLVANRLTQGRARVRLSVSGGENPLTGGEVPGNVIITAVPQQEPAAFAKVIVSPFSHNENSALTGAKSFSYGAHLLAYRNAIQQGADEALMLNSTGNLCEGTMSNVFLVQGGMVRTPSLQSGCLPGVTRAIVIELCSDLGIDVVECELSENDLGTVTEMFLTSSAREVQPATMDMAARECHCAVTTRIAAAYTKHVRNETKA